MISTLIEKLLCGEDIDPKTLEEALHQIMTGNIPQPLTAGLLVALRGKELNAATLAACARAMRAHRLSVETTARPLIDTCGTGGDGTGTFNISTAAAFVVAAAGGGVAKHGNRSVSSKAGSADVLEASGAAINLGSKEVSKCLDATGFAFLFAPTFHPAMANVAPVRKALGIRTLFNLLGPLTNPALADCQLIGIYDPAITKIMAEALLLLETESALVIHCDGLDEIGLHGVTIGHLVKEGKVIPFSLDPRELGFKNAPLSELKGGDASDNALILNKILNGEEGVKTDVVALNAAAALNVSGIASDIADGLTKTYEILKTGAAAHILNKYIETSQRLYQEQTKA